MVEKKEESDEEDEKVEDIVFKCELCDKVCGTNTELECHIKCEHARPRTNPFEDIVIDRSPASTKGNGKQGGNNNKGNDNGKGGKQAAGKADIKYDHGDAEKMRSENGYGPGCLMAIWLPNSSLHKRIVRIIAPDPVAPDAKWHCKDLIDTERSYFLANQDLVAPTLSELCQSFADPGTTTTMLKLITDETFVTVSPIAEDTPADVKIAELESRVAKSKQMMYTKQRCIALLKEGVQAHRNEVLHNTQMLNHINMNIEATGKIDHLNMIANLKHSSSLQQVTKDNIMRALKTEHEEYERPVSYTHLTLPTKRIV